MSAQFKKKLPKVKWAKDSMDCHKKLMSSANWVYQAGQATSWQSEAERQVEGFRSDLMSGGSLQIHEPMRYAWIFSPVSSSFIWNTWEYIFFGLWQTRKSFILLFVEWTHGGRGKIAVFWASNLATSPHPTWFCHFLAGQSSVRYLPLSLNLRLLLCTL